MADDIAAQCVIVQAMWKSAYQACAGVAVQHAFDDPIFDRSEYECWLRAAAVLFSPLAMSGGGFVWVYGL